jgi:EmrB/QacA subfamily drug resistance transporter
MSTLDSSMVNIALPSIMADFASPLQLTEWVVMIYLLTITATLLLWGHLGDMLGRGRFYASGMVLFAIASLACALAPSLTWLIVARLVQAMGAAMMMAIGPALISQTFPIHQLGRGFGLIGVAVSLGLMTGPVVGGLLLEVASWRMLFLITVPVGGIAALLALLVLPLAGNPRPAGPFDWSGAILMCGGLILLSLTVNQATAATWTASGLAPLLVATLLAFFLFLRAENRATTPLLPMGLLQERFFIAAVISAVLSFVTLFAVIVLIPFYLDRILRLSSANIGLVMLAIPATVLFVAPVAGWLSDQVGGRLLTTAGLMLSTAGLLLLAGLKPGTSPAGVAIRLIFLGGGQALFLAPNSATVLGRVKNRHAGISAALLATARNMGMLLGTGLAFLVFSLVFGLRTGGLDLKDFTPDQTNAFMAGLSAAFLAAAALGGAAAIVSWSRGPEARRPAEPEA